MKQLTSRKRERATTIMGVLVGLTIAAILLVKLFDLSLLTHRMTRRVHHKLATTQIALNFLDNVMRSNVPMVPGSDSLDYDAFISRAYGDVLDNLAINANVSEKRDEKGRIVTIELYKNLDVICTMTARVPHPLKRRRR